MIKSIVIKCLSAVAAIVVVVMVLSVWLIDDRLDTPGVSQLEIQSGPAATEYGLLTQSGQAIPIVLPEETFFMLTEGSFLYTAPDESFDILFYAPNGAVTVSLLQEPLAESRQKAERYIVENFNVAPDRLCQLNARIITNRFVSSFYADQELGFSTCADSVPL